MNFNPTDSSERFNSFLKNIFENEFYDEEEDKSYIQYIKYIKDKDIVFNDRGTEGIYMSHQVFEEWGFFCDSIPKKKAELTEKALLLFMINYPKKDILIKLDLNINKSKKAQQKLQDTVLCNDLKAWLDRVKNKHIIGELDVNSGMWSRFMELCREASKFNNPSPRLEKLMEEASELI